MELGQKSGWNPGDVTFLASLSSDDFYVIFKRFRGKELHQAITGALIFRDIGNADEAMKKVTTSAVSALQRIGQESDINRRRVTQRGVAVPETNNTGSIEEDALK